MERFLIRRMPSGFKFDLKAANGETIASSEVYASLPACRKGIRSVSACAPGAKLLDLTLAETKTVTNPKFEIFRDKAGEYRFRLRARNGEIILSSEGYTARSSCERGVESVRINSQNGNEK